jgi:hypothetical protein
MEWAEATFEKALVTVSVANREPFEVSGLQYHFEITPGSRRSAPGELLASTDVGRVTYQ